MKLKTILASALAVLAIATSCKKDPAPAPAVKDMTIKFTPSLYQFVKATDTAFEEADQIGVNIFKGEEVYLYNALYTMTEGTLISETAHKWYKETEVAATITAVYPRTTADEYNSTESFTISSDQSTAEGYAASDLLFAATTATPTENAVALPFKHALSKIVVNVVNNLDEEIEDVWFTDVYGSVTFDPKNPFETLAISGDKGTVKAAKGTDGSYVLIVVPQENALPKVALTTASGKQYTFVLEESVTFTSGKVRTADITVNENSIYTSFTTDITDWTSDSALNFSQDESTIVLPGEGENGGGEVEQNTHFVFLQPNNNWKQSNARFVAYSWADGIEATWTDMTDTDGDGVYYCTVPGNHTEVIFCRMNPNVSENRWNNDSDTDATKPLWNQSPDLKVPTGREKCYKIGEGVWSKDDSNPSWSGSWIVYEK